MCAVLHSLPDQDLRVVVTVDGHQITLGQHAIDRYWERVKPTLPSAAAAAADLEHTIAGCARIHVDAPAWKASVHTPGRHERPAVAWLSLGDDIALPLTACLYRDGDYFVPTCLAKGACGDELRARRAQKRRAESQARAQRRAAVRRTTAYRKQTASHRAARLRAAYLTDPDLDMEAA